jgi:hypothetical protein
LVLPFCNRVRFTIPIVFYNKSFICFFLGWRDFPIFELSGIAAAAPPDFYFEKKGKK